MKNEIIYEWTIETIDEYGDVIENDFAEKLSSFDKDEIKGKDLGLVRNEGNEIDGLEDRYWAYVKDDKLPEYFEDGAGYHIAIKVPQRFHKELEKYLNK